MIDTAAFADALLKGIGRHRGTGLKPTQYDVQVGNLPVSIAGVNEDRTRISFQVKSGTRDVAIGTINLKSDGTGGILLARVPTGQTVGGYYEQDKDPDLAEWYAVAVGAAAGETITLNVRDVS